MVAFALRLEVRRLWIPTDIPRRRRRRRRRRHLPGYARGSLRERVEMENGVVAAFDACTGEGRRTKI